jgi:dynein heavy chain, axonemal
MVRGPLPPLQRTSLGTLITMDVHARDVVDSLLKHGVRNQADFEWQMQLRYSWSEAADDIVIRQVGRT